MSIRLTVVFGAIVVLATGTYADTANAQSKPRIRTLGGLRPPAAQPAQTPQATPAKAKPTEKLMEEAPPAAGVTEPVDDSPAPNIEAGERLDVMCFGGGSANKLDVLSGHASHSVSGSFNTLGGPSGTFSGSGTSWATMYVPRSQDFADQVSLFIEGGEGRVRMPRTMLPTIRGGKDGWFKLKDIKIAPNEITGSVAVNILNNPKFRLDRYSGALSISGKAGDYVGGCRRIDPERMKRIF